MFSRIMDSAVDAHFKKDQSGRLVFIPLTLKGKCYFVDSKSDEEKIRAFVKLFRSSVTLISWLAFPSVFIPAVILDDFAGLAPRGHRMAVALGIPLFFWLILGALAALLWVLYKKTVPGVTASLSEVGSDAKGQLREISSRPRRVAMVTLFACLGLLILMIFGIVGWHHAHNKCVCPAEVPSASTGSSTSPIR